MTHQPIPTVLAEAIAVAHRRRPPTPFPARPDAEMRVGDIVQVRPDATATETGEWFTPDMPALWYVSRIYADDGYFTGHLVTNETDFACEADWITHVTPYRAVIQGELYGTVGIDQVAAVVAHAGPHKSHLRDLDGHDEYGRPFLPLAGPADPRWQFKHEELRRLYNYVLVTRRRLLDELWPDGDQ